MKYLYLLLSVFKSWFTKQWRLTLSVMLMFFFSAFVMLFTATVIGNDFLWTLEEETWASKTYYFYTSSDRIVGSELIFGENILYSLYSSASNSIERIEAELTVYADKLGEKENAGIVLMPVYKESYGENIYCVMWAGNGGKSDFYHSEQNVKEGRGIGSQDIENENKVVILPEGYGVEIGESITLFGEQFVVIGITSDEYGRIAGLFTENAALLNENCECIIRYVEFDKPMTDETYQALNKAVYETMGTQTVVYSQPELSDDPQIVYTVFMAVLGVIVAIFTMCGIYYPALRLCKETMPMLFTLKLCGMRILSSFGLLFISMLVCLALSFGLSSLTLLLSKDFFAGILSAFELRSLFFGLSAIVFTLVTVVAMLPPILKMAKMQPAEEVEK